jgi:hypothetical protein
MSGSSQVSVGLRGEKSFEVSKRAEGSQWRADFLDRLRSNPAFGRLVGFPGFDSVRRSRFEEFCWRLYGASLRRELSGARAKRALSGLLRLRQLLGDCAWLKQSVGTSLDELQTELEKLARRSRRGRREDQTAQVFREGAEGFVRGGLTLRERRLPSRDSVDEALAGVFAVVFGRTISVQSFARMRQRERAKSRQVSVETQTPSETKSRSVRKSTSRKKARPRAR